MRNFFLLVFAALLLSVTARSANAYLDQSFSVYVKVLDSGDARITEKTVFFLETEAEKEAFDYYLHLGNTTLYDWKRFSQNIKYHFSGANSGLRIVAAREYEVHPNAASVTLEYDASGVMLLRQVSSRITKYTLNTPLIALISSKGEISLGNGMTFTMELPTDAQEINVSPDPGPGRQQNVISWRGPIFGKWDVEFQREKSLNQEVSEFFVQSLEDLRNNYLWLLLLFFAIIVGFKFFANQKE